MLFGMPAAITFDSIEESRSGEAAYSVICKAEFESTLLHHRCASES